MLYTYCICREIPDELDLFQSLKAEIEEANKEAESISYLSDARKS